MFRISRRLEYGVDLLTGLAELPEDLPISTAAMAQKLGIPLPFLHQIGHSLMQSGFIKALPGPRGGLRLNRPAREIRLAEVVEALEGPVNLLSTEDGTSRQDNGQSKQMEVWRDLQSKIILYLSNITLDQLVEDGNRLDGLLFDVAGKQIQQSIDI